MDGHKTNKPFLSEETQKDTKDRITSIINWKKYVHIKIPPGNLSKIHEKKKRLTTTTKNSWNMFETFAVLLLINPIYSVYSWVASQPIPCQMQTFWLSWTIFMHRNFYIIHIVCTFVYTKYILRISNADMNLTLCSILLENSNIFN